MKVLMALMNIASYGLGEVCTRTGNPTKTISPIVPDMVLVKQRLRSPCAKRINIVLLFSIEAPAGDNNTGK